MSSRRLWILVIVIVASITRQISAATGSVLLENVTVYDTDTVELSCPIRETEQFGDWKVESEFHRKQSPLVPKERRITYRGVLTMPFESTGRYNVSRDGDNFKLTIAKVNLSEVGIYLCYAQSNERRRIIHVDVSINISTLQNPLNLSVLAGHNVSLSYQVSKMQRLTVLFIESSRAPQFIAWNGSTAGERFTARLSLPINQTSDNFELTFYGVQPNDTGYYVCIEDTDGVVSAHAIMLNVHVAGRDDGGTEVYSFTKVLIDSVLGSCLSIVMIGVCLLAAVRRRKNRFDKDRGQPNVPVEDPLQYHPLETQIEPSLQYHLIKEQVEPSLEYQLEAVDSTSALLTRKKSVDNRLRDVCGVTQVGSRIFVLCLIYVVSDEYKSCGTGINVYSDRHPFEKLKQIDISLLEQPTDIVACHETSQLFVGGSGRDNIWRVDCKSGEHVKFVRYADSVESLSLRSRRLLVTSSWLVNSLCVYDVVNGEKLWYIQLPQPDFSSTTHAIESNEETFFVSHCNGHLNDSSSFWEISEINFIGQTIRSSGRGLNLDCPRHLTFDSVGHLVIADTDNCRVLLLDKHLKLDRVLLKYNDETKHLSTGQVFLDFGDEEHRPRRLNYNENFDQLIVSGVSFVNVYDFSLIMYNKIDVI